MCLVAEQSMSATETAGEVLLRDDFAAKARKMLALPASGPLPDLEMVGERCPARTGVAQ